MTSGWTTQETPTDFLINPPHLIAFMFPFVVFVLRLKFSDIFRARILAFSSATRDGM
jgi:hypothetical protein